MVLAMAKAMALAMAMALVKVKKRRSNMKGVNKVIIVGNLGNDPETRFFPDGGAVTNASIATSESWKDKKTGQMQERTEWHRVVFRDRGNYHLGRIAGEYLKKGSKVYVEGSNRTRKWQDQSGQDRYTTEIVVNEMQMLDSRSAEQQSTTAPQPAPPQNNQGGKLASDFTDDDIPF